MHARSCISSTKLTPSNRRQAARKTATHGKRNGASGSTSLSSSSKLPASDGPTSSDGPSESDIELALSDKTMFGVTGPSATLNDPVLSAMARLTLQSAQQHREWEASLLTTYLGPTDSGVTTSMREAGVRYHQEAQTSDAVCCAQLGPPHVRVFGAMSGALVTQISTITPQPGFAEQLRQISAWLGTASLEAVMEQVTVARQPKNTPTEPDESANPCEP